MAYRAWEGKGLPRGTGASLRLDRVLKYGGKITLPLIVSPTSQILTDVVALSRSTAETHARRAMRAVTLRLAQIKIAILQSTAPAQVIVFLFEI